MMVFALKSLSDLQEGSWNDNNNTQQYRQQQYRQQQYRQQQEQEQQQQYQQQNITTLPKQINFKSMRFK